MMKTTWVCCLLIGAAAASAAEPLRIIETIPLPNVEGRIDHMAVDTDGQRLFIAALGNNTLEVVDLAAHKVVHSIGNLHEPQGVGFIQEEGMIAVANGDDGSCRLFDSKTFEPIQTIDFQSDADNVRCNGGRIFVGFGNGAIGEIDAKERRRLSEVKLSAHPESFQLEQLGSRIFVNVPRSHQIAVIDRKQNAVVGTWPVNAQANFPMALDEASHRLFIGCRNPAEVVVYDTNTGKVDSHFPCVGDADDLFYDGQTKRLYVAGGEGFITVHQQSDDSFSQLAKIATASGARTAFFIPGVARLYLAVPHRGSQAAELRAYEVIP